MLYFLTVGAVLGLSAGFAPGPLLALVISETLQHDTKSGAKVALAPLITDLPIIILTLFILSKLSHFHTLLGAISLAGGLFLLAMGCESIRAKGIELSTGETGPNSLAKGVLANALNPHPYLFWVAVGGPIMMKAMSLNISTLLAFVVTFYVCMVGSKILLAIIIGKSKSFLNDRAYLSIMRFLGVVLCLVAITLFHNGLTLLGLMKALP